MCDEDKVFLLFGSIKKKLYKIINNEIKKYNISVPEAIYLLVINNNENISFKELTSIVDCDKAMTTKVMNSLKKKELVNNNTKDISLTNKGNILVENVSNDLTILKEKIIKKIKKKELKRIFDNIKEFNMILEEIC